MSSIYVCLFSTGLIKVGRSINPFERLQAHEDRLSCAGITRSNSAVYKCIGSGPATEAHILRSLRKIAATVRGNEWFTGLDFSNTCTFVKNACETIIDSDKSMNWHACEVIEALGGTGYVSKIFDISKASVSDWKVKGIPPARMMYLKVKYQKHIKEFDLDSATAICRRAKSV